MVRLGKARRGAAWRVVVVASLRDHLQSIYDNSGMLTPAIVLETARDPAHPLHSRFTWDDNAAAESWRKHQAQELIRSVRIVYREATETEPARSVRAFHAVRRENGHVYEPAEKVAEDPFTKKLLLADMEREWKQLHRRYQEFAEFAEMVKRDIEEKAA
jgi:hypothetical protein